MKTKQEAFDECFNHLIKQGKKSIKIVSSIKFGTCMYRSLEGLSCAIGCFVDDETAKIMDEYWDGTSIDNLIDNIPEVLPNWMLRHDMKDLLISLQNAHDNYFDDMQTFIKEMKMIAITYGLEFKEPTNV